MKRKGLGRGKGKGYKNLQGRDPKIHSDSARGRKQPQKLPTQVKISLNKKTRKVTKFNVKLRDVSEEDYEEIEDRLGDQPEQLQKIDNQIWNDLGVSDGDELRKKWAEYLREVDKRIINDINQFNYLFLEEENYHSLNEALEQLGKFATVKESFDEIDKLR